MAGTDLQQLIDETLQQAVEAMLEAELSVDTADDGHKHHGWSPMYIPQSPHTPHPAYYTPLPVYGRELGRISLHIADSH